MIEVNVITDSADSFMNKYDVENIEVISTNSSVKINGATEY